MSTTYEPGLYKAVVTSQGFSKSQQKGTLSFDVGVEIQAKSDPVSKELSPVSAGRRTLRHYITPATMEPGKVTYEQLKSLGVYGDFNDYNPDNPDHRSLIGKEVMVWCSADEYQGKPTERWQVSTGPRGVQNDPEAVAKLAVLSLPPLPPPPAQEQKAVAPPAGSLAAAAAATVSDQDLPF